MILTKKHVSRRAVLQGMGVTIALPFLDAMAPAATPLYKTAAAPRTRLAAIEMVHGSAGSTVVGAAKNLWAPALEGGTFDLTPSSLVSLEPYRDYLTIVSNTDVRNAEAFEAREVGGDHFRSSAVFLTQAHPKQTESSDVRVGPSLDQLYAQAYGMDTPIPSMQLCIENVDQSGGCAYGFARNWMNVYQVLAAADGARSARRLRPALRRRRHRERARGAAQDRFEHPRLDRGRSRHDEADARRRRSPPPRRVPR